MDLDVPTGPQLLPAALMSPQMRAHACWLSLCAGWPLEPDGWAFDPVSNQTIVYNARGDVTFSKLWKLEADEWMARIAERFREDGRLRARVRVNG